MEQRRFNITYQKVTAVLCALVILFGVIAFFGGNLTDEIDYLNERIASKEEQIAQMEEYIDGRRSDIAGYEQEKKNAQEALSAAKKSLEEANAAVSTARIALDQAEDALDQVCSRSSYSSWYCSASCRTLHTQVTERKTAAENANKQVRSLQNTISNIEYDIETYGGYILSAEQDIENTQERITQIRAEIKELDAQLSGAWFVVVFKFLALLLSVGGLGLLVKNFYNETQDQFTLYAVAGLGAGAVLFWIAGAINNVLFENAPLGYLLLTPYSWTIAIMALFAVILLDKTEKPVVLRNIAVVLSVIMALTFLANGYVFVGLLFAAAMICAAFVIVPLVFTKYIDIAKHIFLSLITFGIWQLVWTYHVTKNLNEVEAVEDRKPSRELLLCLFLPLYYIYWLYKTAEGVEDYGKENDKEFKIDVLCLAFAFVSPVFSSVLIQNKINVVAGKPVAAEQEIPEEAEQEISEEAEQEV